ncbi:MAG: DotA/TraY family protein [Betaproteobacteria bacterium]|nr:DotA/TraY family protein [Betaproteobacteria bacterium]
MLAGIFGSANGIFGGADDPSVNAMFMAFNTAVLAVAAAYFSYNLMAATVQGSFDGEFLGRRFSSVWMPIRSATGAAFLIPVWKGWNLAQLIMALCASIGIGIGNMTWAGLNGEITPALVTPPAITSLADLAQPITAAHVCLANRWADQARLKKANVDAAATEYQTNWDRQMVGDSTWVGINYGAIPAINGFTETTCGFVAVDFPQTSSDDPDVQAVITVARTAMSSALVALDSDIAKLVEPAKTMDPDDPDAVINLEKSMQDALPRIVAQRQAELDSAITGIVNARNAKVSERIKEMSLRYGWLAAGATPLIITMNSIDVARGTPQISSEAPKANPETPTVQTPSAAGNNYGTRAGQTAAARRASNPPQENACGLSSVGKDYFQRCVETPLINKIKSAGIGSLVGATSGNPIIFSQQLGLKILNMVGTTIAVVFGIIALAAFLAGVTGPAFPSAGAIIGAGLNFFGIILAVILIPLVAFAVQLVAFVPLMIPIAWIMAIGAWLVVVAESLVAATLWALVHLDPEGEGMGQRTAHGYIYALNLLFRPAVLVFAAFFSQRFCAALGGLANGMMSGAIAKMMEANSSSLFVFLILMGAGIWIVTMLNIKIVGISASLLHIIPNQIFTWIGGHFGSDVGSGIPDSVGHDVKGGIGQATGALSRGAMMGTDVAGKHASNLGVDQNEAGIKAAIQRQNWEAAAQERRGGHRGTISNSPDGTD